MFCLCYLFFLFLSLSALRFQNWRMVWYGMVNVDLYSAIITKVSNALEWSLMSLLRTVWGIV